MHTSNSQTEEQRKAHYDLELIHPRPSILTRANAILRQLWVTGLKTLSDLLIPPDEPRIKQIQTRHGETIWKVYAPSTDQKLFFSSEEELLTWLDRPWRR